MVSTIHSYLAQTNTKENADYNTGPESRIMLHIKGEFTHQAVTVANGHWSIWYIRNVAHVEAFAWQ